jgi:hypothetical protein
MRTHGVNGLPARRSNRVTGRTTTHRTIATISTGPDPPIAVSSIGPVVGGHQVLDTSVDVEPEEVTL